MMGTQMDGLLFSISLVCNLLLVFIPATCLLSCIDFVLN